MALKMKQKQNQKQVQSSDLEQKIDTAYMLDTEIKEKKKVLDGVKKELKAVAQGEGKKSLSGELAEVSFIGETQNEVNPKDLYIIMEELGMGDAFWDLVKVKLGDAKSKVGELALDSIMTSEYNEYAKMKFKKRG